MTLIETASGQVAGALENGIRHWYGIPYAQAERFAPPGPVEPWQSTRDATAMAPQCPQMFGSNAKRARLDGDYGEDCLALNIWSPDNAEPGSRPVFFWIHGGAFLAGSCNSYRGAELARTGDMVVVGINYRVGVLGFANLGEALGLPQIPSNLGLRDQIAALTWVRDNIAGFGGDPNRVTIAGQSAGSMSVSLLMMCRAAWPLFHGAIMQSGAVSLIQDRATSRRIGRRYAELLDVNQGDLDALRRMDLRRLFEAQGKIDSEERNGLPAAPWYDGDLLPASLAEAQAHPHPPVPLLAGATREEVRLFELMPGDILPTSWADLETLLGQLPADQAAHILSAYPRSKAGRRALASDLTFAMPTRNFAERHARSNPTWFYRFDYSHPLAGPTHGLDLTLFWPIRGFRAALARGGRMSGRRAALGQRMNAHWAHFTNHGRPLEDWPAYSASDRMVKLFNLDDGLAVNPDAERLAAWAGRDVPARTAEPTG